MGAQLLSSIVFLIVAMSISMTACDDDSGSRDNTGPAVYVAGYDVSASVNGIYTPCIWIDNGSGSIKQKSLVFSPGIGGVAKSIFVTGGTVYIGGEYWEAGDVYHPCYWANTARTDYDMTGIAGGTVRSIFVDDGTIYSAGAVVLDSSPDSATPVYWAGLQRTTLESYLLHDAHSLAMYVSDGTVYTGGFYNSVESEESEISNACYWEGDEMVQLAHSTVYESEVYSIFVSGGSVYSGGRHSDADGSRPCYWIGNSAPVDLPLKDGAESGSVQSIYIDNGTVYACGGQRLGEDSYAACCWINGARIDIPAPYAEGYNYSAWSIFVHDGTAYVAGSYINNNGQTACYWKVTDDRVELVDLPGDGVYVQAASIFYQ